MQDDKTPDSISLEAVQWFVRLRDDKASTDDRRAFEVWLSLDDRHRAAWSRAEELWRRFDIVEPEIRQLRPAVVTRRKAVLGMTALLGAGAGAYLTDVTSVFADHVTGIGERRSLALSDGSKVELGSHSAISVGFTDRLRQVTLHRGQGFFDVAAGDGRPFVVAAGSGATEALGTQFDVKLLDDLVTVAVVEKTVMVRAGDHAPVGVEQEWQLTYGAVGPMPVVRFDAESALAWRRDRIVFQDVPLRRVLAELERYRRGRVMLMDRRIADMPVTAVFDTHRANEALETIAEALPLRVLYATNYVAMVYGR